MKQAYQKKLPHIAKTAWIHPTACVIGDVTLADQVSIWPMAVIRGDVNRIFIDTMTNIQDASVLHVSHVGPIVPNGSYLSIGKKVTVGHKAMLHGCCIKDSVLIGINAVVLDKVLIESNVILGAGSLVPANKQLHTGLWVGQPAKWIRDLTAAEKKNIVYSAEHYHRLKLSYEEINEHFE